MIGARGRNGASATFVERQIATLESRSVEIRHLPSLNLRHSMQRRFCLFLWRYAPLVMIPRDVREAFAQADILHFQWPRHFIEWIRIARRFRKPVVLSLRGRQISILPWVPGTAGYVCQLRKLLPLCDAFHCVSDAISLEAEAFGLAHDRSWTIRPAIDPDYFHPPVLQRSTVPFQIAMVGALIWRKGYEYALMALHLVAKRLPEVRLVIVGDGEDRDRILETARDLEVADRLELLGRRDPEGVRGIIWQSHVLLHASLSEGIANVVLEAMACGVPVVSTSVGGMREVIDDGVEGYLVPTRDADAMASRLVSLAIDTGLRARLGANARSRAIRAFDLRDQGSRFISLYRRILDGA